MKPRVAKRIVHAGRGNPINFTSGSKAIFDYRAELLPANSDSIDSLEVVDDSRRKWPHGYGAPLELVFGKQFQIPVWEECLKTMLVDEVCCFDVVAADLANYPMVSKKLRDIGRDRDDPKRAAEHGSHLHSTCFGLTGQMGLGYPELDKLVQEPSNIRFTFHLHKVLFPEDYEPDSWQLNSDQRLSSVKELRTRGNSYFKSGNVEDALQQYGEALGRLDSLVILEKPGELEWTELDNMKIPLYLNVAQCKLKLERFYEAIDACNEALSRDSENDKGLFRRAKAFTAVWKLEEARKDFHQLVKLKPEMEGLIWKEMRTLDKLVKEKEAKDKEVYLSMFSE